jgi:hypothetical protein
MDSVEAHDPFALYARLGFVIVSAKMSATKSKNGEWKKHFAFPRGWQNKDSADIGRYDKRVSGFALVTGAKSGATAIDIDDPETAQNKRLMELMRDCNLVARTKKGYHYVFRYDARVLNAAGNELGTRNDGGYIFVAPSAARDDKGRTVAEYRWVHVPRDDEHLAPVPEAVIEFLRSIDRVRYVPASSSSSSAAPTAPARDAELMAQAMREASSCGKRNRELMMVREAIVACTDPALEANVPKAAESLLVVLEYCDRRDEHGELQSLGNFTDLGLFFYYVWRRVARFGYDKTHQWPFYLFNGATYELGQLEQLHMKAEEHLRAVIAVLSVNEQINARAESLDTKCTTSDLISRGLTKMQMSLKYVERLAGCGLISPTEFERELDMGNYIGFTNGVYDMHNDRFMPKGTVPLNVLVSMCAGYAYVGPDDPKFPETRAQIEEFYRTLFAARTSAMWLRVGSLLCRENVCEKTYVFFGEGDSGKTTFTRLIQLTLGDYAVGSNDTRALVRVCTGGPEAAVYRAPGSGARPLVHARVRPPAERWIWPVEFGSTFVAGLDAPDPQRRRYPRETDLGDKMREWAPYHFLMMLEAHRAFRAVGPLIPEALSALHVPVPRPGTVYAFVTPVMPGIVKIGATTRDLADRLREANESDTWRPPEPYVVACAARVTAAFAAERSLHTALCGRRVNAHREFFRLTVEEARAVFALLLDPWPRFPIS